MAEAALTRPALVDSTTIRRVILASSLGTLFEWYDFFVYGSLAAFFGSKFFPPGNPTTQLLASLATFGAGFGVRPLGALVFGHIGDLIGRKYTFLVTMATMGLSTALIGFLPTYDKVGITATVLLVFLRLLQGLALGGEYGGAATYVAEHVPDSKRGYYTSFIQATATIGFFVSILVVGVTRSAFGEAAFKSGGGALGGISGWRIPFLLSFVLLGVSFYIRLSMKESPLFSKLKVENKVSVNPLKESFTNPVNLRYVLLALFGATAAQGVVWYTGQFYALTFLTSILKLDWKPAYFVLSIALVLGTPLLILFGSISDSVGRKKIMIAGMVLALFTYLPIYWAMHQFGNPTNMPKVMWEDLSAGSMAALVALIWVQLIYVSMVYGPIAAFLVELFPTNIRYTSMSLPYHLGNGWFGGFLPLIATAVTTSAAAKAAFGDNARYAGLLYPMAIALIGIIVGGMFIHETRDKKIDTSISAASTGEARFDWTTVLIGIVIAYVLLVVAAVGLKMGMISGVAMNGVGDALFNIIPAFAIGGVPVIFFRLAYPRAKALGLVFGSLLATLIIGYFLYPMLTRAGGAALFFADTLMVVLYTVILLIVYRAAGGGARRTAMV